MPMKPSRPKRVRAPKWRLTCHVEYILPNDDPNGDVVYESRPIEDFDVDAVLEDLPPNAVAFSFYFLKEADVWVEDDLVYVGKTDRLGGRYFIGGAVYTEAQVYDLALGHDDQFSTLLDNIRTHGLSRVIHTRADTWMAFEDEDVQLPIPVS